MIDASLQPLIRRSLTLPALWLQRRGVSADTVTLTGFGIGLLAIPAIALQAPALALLCLAANRILDGLDGTLARLSGPTDRGAFIDITCDFLFYALFPLGFALADPPANALAAAILITAFVGTGTTFLAFSTVAARRGETAAAFPAKGIYYLGGITEGAETIALFAAMCLFPKLFPWLACGFAAACTVTAGLRFAHGWRAFGTNGRALKRTARRDMSDLSPASPEATPESR